MKVNTNNIIYVETIKHNTLVHLRGNNYVCTQTMKEMCNLLENEGFFKCHQSYLVNLPRRYPASGQWLRQAW